MKKSRPCPGPAAASPCVGAGFIEADRGATAERCKRCSALRARQREAKRRRELTRIAREGWALSATAPVEIPPTADTQAHVPRSGPPGAPASGPGSSRRTALRPPSGARRVQRPAPGVWRRIEGGSSAAKPGDSSRIDKKKNGQAPRWGGAPTTGLPRPPRARGPRGRRPAASEAPRPRQSLGAGPLTPRPVRGRLSRKVSSSPSHRGASTTRPRRLFCATAGGTGGRA